jgi:hypothetical protein
MANAAEPKANRMAASMATMNAFVIISRSRDR